jgi:hypothetical protein
MWKQIVKTTLIAGCLDITAACIQAYLSKAITPDMLLRFIASGVFGKDAFSGGFGFTLFGLLVHFFIVFACTLIYFFVYPKLKLLHKNILLSSLLIALIAWAITTRLIIPLSKIQAPAFNFTKALIAISVLYFCIGLPIAFFTKHFYTKKRI